MITVTKKTYDTIYPSWVTRCPLCNEEELDAIIKISSVSLNYTHFAIGKKCREELAKKLLKPEKEQK